MNTLWSNRDKLMINPPNWAAALHFLETFTDLSDEFSRIELASTGMFDLDHLETAEKIDLTGAVRAIKLKSKLAKEVLQWIVEHQHILETEQASQGASGS